MPLCLSAAFAAKTPPWPRGPQAPPSPYGAVRGGLGGIAEEDFHDEADDLLDNVSETEAAPSTATTDVRPPGTAGFLGPKPVCRSSL